jgi:hypothetical protein
LLLASTQVAANLIPDYEFGFFADVSASADTVFDDGFATLAIYIVMNVNVNEVHGIRFSAPNPPCFNGTLIEESYAFPTAGTAQTGVWVDFGGCVTGQILVGTLTFSVEGLTGDCCWYVPQPHEGFPDILLNQCPDEDVWFQFPPGSLLINPNHCASPTPVEESTWGRIKAFYSN